MRKVILFDERLRKEFKEIDQEVTRIFYGLIKVLGERGELSQPEGKKLKGYKNLYEIRVKHKGQWRGLYAYILKDSIVILSLFRKKSQKTPISEIKKAQSRLKDYENKR